jgi:hypothetical protein
MTQQTQKLLHYAYKEEPWFCEGEHPLISGTFDEVCRRFENGWEPDRLDDEPPLPPAVEGQSFKCYVNVFHYILCHISAGKHKVPSMDEHYAIPFSWGGKWWPDAWYRGDELISELAKEYGDEPGIIVSHCDGYNVDLTYCDGGFTETRTDLVGGSE